MNVPLRVCVAGPRWVAQTTESVAAAFAADGATVQCVHYAYWEPLCGIRRLGSWQRRYFRGAADRRCRRITHERILAACAGGCDLLFVVIGDTVAAETVHSVRDRHGARTALWLVDDPLVVWEQPPRFREETCAAAAAYDRVYVFDDYYLPALRAHTGADCRHLPLAYDETIFSPAVEEKRYQVVMVGEWSAQRAACLAALDGVAADVWGGHFRDVRNCTCHPRVTPAAACTIYRQATVCFNANHPQSIWDCNTRVFEVTGAGGCLLTDARSNLPAYYQAGEELLVYSTPRECADLVRHLLAHPEEAACIGARGAERALREHTFRARMHGVRNELCRESACRQD